MSEQKFREFWIDDIMNFDPSYRKSAYLYEQDTEKFKGKIIHVIEYSALESLQKENAELKEQLKIAKEALKDIGMEKFNGASVYSGAENMNFYARQALEQLETTGE